MKKQIEDNGTHLHTLLQMDIGEIKQLQKAREKVSNELGDIIDQQQEKVASAIEQNNIKEDWAEKFLEDMKIW